MKKIYAAFLIAYLAFGFNEAVGQSQELIQKTLSVGELPAGELFQFPNAVKTKYVQIDFGILNDQEIYNLSLFDGQNLQFKFEKLYQYTMGSSSWYGKSTAGFGDIIISFYQNHINGIIVDGLNKKYMLQQINQSDLFAITLVNVEDMNESQAGVQDYVVNDEKNKKSRANPDVCALGTTCPTSTIDIMVLGSAQAIINGGGTVPAFTVNVTSAITEMNTAYANSGGTNLTFNLIHCNSTAFVTTADLFDDLSNFSADAGVQALRNTYYADLVSLWAGSGSYAGFCGVGYLNSNATNYSSSSAYNVCDYGCGMTNLSFAHECGHNMGLRHDYYVDAALTPCANHHGYTNAVVIPTGLPVPGRWRTVMAYNNECSANGFNCSRIARWANPATNYLGDPTGVAIGMPNTANEIYGFERFKCVVAAFRNNPLPLDLLSFEGKNLIDKCHLTWRTANENNFKGFQVEMKKTYQEEFKSIAFAASKGNSTGVSTYNLLTDPLMSGKYYFRLKQLDLDNNFKYSDVIEIGISGNVFQSSIFPNPAKDQFTISLYNPKNQALKITLFDMLGNAVVNIYDENSAIGNKEIHVSTAGLSKGIYICNISGTEEKYITKVVIE